MIATIKKVLVSFAMLIFLLPFSPHEDSILPLSDSPEAKAASIIYTTTANLNLRSGSSTKHKVLTVIPKGRQVSLLSNHGSWYKIRFANKTGYASSAYLKPASTVTDSIKYATTANLNLRTGAGTKYKVLIVIPKGKQVSLLSRHGTWYRVKYSTKSGYVSSDYLRKIQSPANQDSAKLTVKNGITYVDGIIIVNKRYSLPSSYNPGGSRCRQ
jgi:D-alanyl-D-alanine carboxypeptidase